MNINTLPKKWAQCLSVYKGSKWKGQEIKIEEAKVDYKEREDMRKQKFEEQRERRRKILSRWNDSNGFIAKDMSLVTDNNMNGKRGWKRGRYGRAIALMKLTKPDGSKFVFDPNHYKNNLTKLYNIGVPMKPVSRLITHISDDEDEDNYLPSEDDEDEIVKPRGALADTRLLDDEKRRAAIERRGEEQKSKMGLISKSLAGELNDQANHVKFDTEEKQTVEPSEEEEKPPLEEKKWLFDSDDEEDDEEMDIKINPVLEGEAGRKRLELQSRFKGDDRFKLGDDFIDEEEQKPVDLGDSISQGLHAEKGQAMDVLRSMFGEERATVKKSTTSSNVWSNAARFDPDAEDSQQYIVSSKIPEDVLENNEDTEMGESDDDLFDAPRKAESAAPIVSAEKHFEVNTNLKPLFGESDGGFKLFGGFNDDENEEKDQIELDETPEVNPIVNLTPKTPSNSLGLGVMFFFHYNNPSLMKKSCYSYDREGIFQNKAENQDDYEKKWREQRVAIKDVLKKRQKQALRNQKKRITRDLK
ncbi:unnamed protein product [Rhizopus stolonifer]